MVNMRIVTWNVGNSDKIEYNDNNYYLVFKNVFFKKISGSFPDVIVICTQEDKKNGIFWDILNKVVSCKEHFDYSYLYAYNKDVTDMFAKKFKVATHVL